MTVYDFFPEGRRAWFLSSSEGRAEVMSTEVREPGASSINLLTIFPADDPTKPWHLHFPQNTVLVMKEREQ